MGRPHSLDHNTRGNIQMDLECGMPPKAIAEITGYS